MKTQIIQLEIHDDTISVKDKMDWSQTPRVLLVWPDGGKVLQNRLDLVLLDRYSTINGSQLALLTKDQKVIDQAEEVGIPVFTSRRAAQLQPWGKSHREFTRQDLVRDAQEPRQIDLTQSHERTPAMEMPALVRIMVFSIGVLAVIAIGGYLLPSATVIIPSQIRTQSMIIPVTAGDPDIPLNISGIVPSRELIVSAEGEEQLPTTGEIAVPTDYAEGEVVFTNLGDQSVRIPQNTFLSSDGEDPVIFITKISAETPIGKGEQVAVPIRALEPGKEGNLPAGEISLINQELDGDLAVNNPQPLSGGDEINLPAPSELDRENLYQLLLEELEGTALDKAQNQLEEGDMLIDLEPQIIETSEISFQPDQGQVGETIKASGKLDFVFTYISRTDLESLAVQAVKARYTSSDISPLESTITLEIQEDVDAPDDDTGRSWSMMVSWDETVLINEPEVLQLIMGEKPENAAKLLQDSLGTASRPSINLNPNWWWWIPALPFRITILQGEG